MVEKAIAFQNQIPQKESGKAMPRDDLGFFTAKSSTTPSLIKVPLVGLGMMDFEAEGNATRLTKGQVDAMKVFYRDFVETALCILQDKGYETGLAPNTKQKLNELCAEILSIVWSNFQNKDKDGKESSFTDVLYNNGSEKRALDDNASSFLVADILNQFKVKTKLVAAQDPSGNPHILLKVGKVNKRYCLSRKYNLGVGIAIVTYFRQFYLETKRGEDGLGAITYNSEGILRQKYKTIYGECDYSARNFITCSSRGHVRAMLGDYKGAKDDYTESIRMNPDYAEAYKNRSICFGKLGMKKEADEDLEKYLELAKKQK